MRRSSVAALIAIFSVGCETAVTDFASVERDLHDAVVQGDFALARQIGYEWLGKPVEGDAGDPQLEDLSPFVGVIAGEYLPNGNDPKSAAMTGTLISEDDVTTFLHGLRSDPGQGLERGDVTAATSALDAQDSGTIEGLWQKDAEASGTLWGIWRADDLRYPMNFEADWTDTAEREGQFFGLYRAIQPPMWGQMVRVRALIDGQSVLEISPTEVRWHHVAGAAPGMVGVGGNGDAEPQPTYVNDKPWVPEWPTEDENVDCDCSSSFLSPPEGGSFAPGSAVSVTVKRPLVRGTITEVQLPTEDNRYKTVLLVDDTDYAGAAWYQFDVWFDR